MRSRVSFLVPLLLMSHMALADSAKPKEADAAKVAPKVAAPDAEKLAKSVNASFYHPEQLNGIQCAVTVDWPKLFEALKTKVPEERMHMLENVQIHSTALRNKSAELTFSWPDGAPSTKDQLEGGLRQMVGGFYQSYWSLMASAPIPKASEISRIEPQADGTTKIYESDANNKVVIDLDSNKTPTHYAFDTTAFKGVFDLKYVDSPKPSAGDLRRMSSAHILANIGASSFNVEIRMDYQPVDGFFVPQHVTYDIVGAYAVSVEFIGCSTIKPPPLAAEPEK